MSKATAAEGKLIVPPQVQIISDTIPQDIIIPVSASQISSPDIATRNSIKIMDGKNGGGFYIRKIYDPSTKHTWRELIIVYPDNTTATVTLYQNACRIMPEGKNGYYASNGYSYIDRPDELKAYQTDDMPIPAFTLARRMREVAVIPTFVINDTITIGQLFAELEAYVMRLSQQPEHVMMSTSYDFLISTEDFRNICISAGWKPLTALRTFEKAGMLIHDEGNGYQYSKRVGLKIVRFYRIRRRLDIGEAGAQAQSLENTAYVDNDRHIIDSMQPKYNSNGKRIRPIRIID